MVALPAFRSTGMDVMALHLAGEPRMSVVARS